MKDNFKKLKGILCDLDGTLYFKNKPISGAIDTINFLYDEGIKTIFLTNTDSKNPDSVLKNLHDLGFTRIKQEDLFTPIIALKMFLSDYSDKKSFFVVSKEVREYLQDYPQVKEDESELPDFVIISDFYDNWHIDRLNKAFRYVLKGSQLIGTQGNLYYIDKFGSEKLDTGAFVNLICNSAKIGEVKIFGKPSKAYFYQALKILGVKPSEAIVIGDDFETDIKGANKAGIKSILVKTGKSRAELPFPMQYKPTQIINSIKELPSFLKKVRPL